VLAAALEVLVQAAMDLTLYFLELLQLAVVVALPEITQVHQLVLLVGQAAVQVVQPQQELVDLLLLQVKVLLVESVGNSLLILMVQVAVVLVL
jgi:hypothetical protein